MYNTIEEELWRIFTFYALHSDPTQPEIWRPATFVRFSRECQFISKKLTPTAVELEVTRVVSCSSVVSVNLFRRAAGYRLSK